MTRLEWSKPQTSSLACQREFKSLSQRQSIKAIKEMNKMKYKFKCDVPHCPCISFVEVYVFDKDNHYWSYLCLTHFILSQLFKHEVGWCLADWILRLSFMHKIWNWWAK